VPAEPRMETGPSPGAPPARPGVARVITAAFYQESPWNAGLPSALPPATP
jgi:hypothetical protein